MLARNASPPPPHRSALADFALFASLAFCLVLLGLNRARLDDFRTEREALVRNALRAAREGKEVPLDVQVVTVRALASTRDFLPNFVVVEQNKRPLRGSATQRDKLLFDAATSALQRGEFARLCPPPQACAIGASPTPGGPAASAVWIAVAADARPPRFPWVVAFGVLGLGALAAAAANRGRPRLRVLGVFGSIACLALPVLARGQWAITCAIVCVASMAAVAHGGGLTMRLAATWRRYRIAYQFVAPAAVAMVVLVITPFVAGIALGFFDHHHGTWQFVGLRNFATILAGGGHSLSDPLNFWFILGVTVLWTVLNVALAVAIGVVLALLLSQRWMRGKRLYRTLLILPWAIPNYITALLWKGMFGRQYGALNGILDALGVDQVDWFASWSTAFFANVTTNTWLGFPFMMVVAIGALQAIPRDLYEAATVDGASAWQRFVHITLPHLRPALGPAVALGSIWTFNMFSVIYLVSDGAPGGATNILVTEAYRWAFERGERYGMAAAYATLIFGILLLWNFVRSRVGHKEHV